MCLSERPFLLNLGATILGIPVLGPPVVNGSPQVLLLRVGFSGWSRTWSAGLFCHGERGRVCGKDSRNFWRPRNETDRSNFFAGAAIQ